LCGGRPKIKARGQKSKQVRLDRGGEAMYVSAVKGMFISEQDAKLV